MKKIIGLVSILIVIISLSGCGLSSNTPKSSATPAKLTAKDAQPVGGAGMINIENFSFSPSSLTIKPGETVTWTNQDSAPHQIKSDTFNSGIINKGQTYSFTFNTIGNFDYSCSIHPAMTGKIIVE